MRLIVITGTTATGKTEISIELAKKINGEIISADSMMVYRYMDIGTAKPTKEERQGIPHHLIDVVNPDEEFSIKDFVKIADEKIKEISHKGKVPLVVGGTWLYIYALLYGLTDAPPSDRQLRKTLYEKDKKELYSKLMQIDPIYASKVHQNDRKRVIRALEVYYLTGKPFSYFHQNHNFKEKRYSFTGFILNRSREEIMERIEKRVESMFRRGLIEETERLLHMGYEKAITAKQAIGYKELIPYIKGNTDLQSAKRQIVKNTKDFAKRQIRTFRSKLNKEGWERIDVSNYTKNQLLDTIIKKLSMEERDEHTG